MRRAIFLDRDGVLNQVVMKGNAPHPPSSVSDVMILSGVKEFLTELRKKGYLLICVTNQPDVGRGLQRREEVEFINARIQSELNLDEIYVCYEAEDSYYKKPGPGMILEAAQKWGIDLRESFMVGDRWQDIEAGKKAGCRAIFVDYGYGMIHPCSPDKTFHTAKEALQWILELT